jgi:hypothetical protein
MKVTSTHQGSAKAAPFFGSRALYPLERMLRSFSVWGAADVSHQSVAKEGGKVLTKIFAKSSAIFD